ncbi:hypothetical protein QVD17_31971 [Tagetes erecta]|uniref:Uncharacterized protein n=1 Tax=Tagetes erecta TaxID=13708 RepID=A0AAD8K4S3_TARER|nr:hypothetical protein QVD17_31971 [Tagetes erecta]
MIEQGKVKHLWSYSFWSSLLLGIATMVSILLHQVASDTKGGSRVLSLMGFSITIFEVFIIGHVSQAEASRRFHVDLSDR